MKIIIPILIAFSTPLYAQDILTIGNSLTADTLPWRLDGNVDFSIFSGKNLTHIRDNPTDTTVNNSVRWDTAMAANTYDFVSVQPYLGTTLAEDTSVISQWMDLQPTATFVIHSGWASSATFKSSYDSAAHNNSMTHNQLYFADLIDNLDSLHPGREIRYTNAIGMLNRVYEDTENGMSPFDDFTDLYRDALHLTDGTTGSGRYLAHNAMRLALGQPTSNVGFPSIDPAEKLYLDGILATASVPEPSGSVLIGIGGLTLLLRRKK